MEGRWVENHSFSDITRIFTTFKGKEMLSQGTGPRQRDSWFYIPFEVLKKSKKKI